MYKLLSVLLFLALSLNAQIVKADDDSENKACPVGLVNGMTIDEEFGAGVQEKTRCLENRKEVKLVMQVNMACRDTTVVWNSDTNSYALENHARSCGEKRGFGIAQMKNMIADYMVTHGIDSENLDLNIIVHGGGGTMLMDMPWNKLKDEVKGLIAKGVKFHFCMNTVRGMAPKMGLTIPQFTSKVIPGVTYVTGGLTALGDFQEEGYVYIQP